ncbi:MAG: hypothetical protein ACLRFE_03725 [Clostridia bacterium]
MEKIKIAVDSCVVIMLSRLASENLSEKDKALMECLKHKTFSYDLYKDVPNKFLPSLLKDKYFGIYEEGDDGQKYYNNLLDMYRLWEMVQKGVAELYITPSVAGELDFEWFEEQIDFIDKYVNVLKVKDEDAKLFYAKRGLLAKDYVEGGAMLEQYNASQRKRVPQNDAYIMAEASLFGLNFVTINEKDFINSNKWKDDYKRGDKIAEINNSRGLIFYSNKPHCKVSPKPITLHSFIMRARHFRKDCNKDFYITNPNIDMEDYTYKNPLSK